MINVLSIVSYNFLPPKMGGQKGIAFFYNFFSQKVNLTCVTTKSNDSSYVKDYTVLPILSESKFRYINLFYFFSIKKIIKQKQITHLIIEHPYYGWLGILLKTFCNVKLIVHSHNIEALRFKSIGKWWWGILFNYEKLTHKKANYNFFIQDDDKAYAIENFKLDAEKCTTITYGFELSQAPTNLERTEAKTFLQKKHGINDNEKILLFNGTLNYQPNLDALKIILSTINPVLIEKENFGYKIIVCGNKLPAELNSLEGHKNIIYAGFVDDITIYFKGADIFLNPVIEGGGIKTKVVEALGYNLSVISTKSGSIGIPNQITNGKLVTVADNNWAEFINNVFTINTNKTIPQEYFDHFYWGSVAEKAVNFIS
jgi:polysaccharide biosynthesis protein PslH